MFLHKIKSDLSTFYKPGKLLRLYYWPQHLFFLKLLPCAHFANQSAAASTNSNSLSFGIRELEMNKKMEERCSKHSVISATLTDVTERSCHCVSVSFSFNRQCF